MGWGALKSKLHGHALYTEQSKTTRTCKGTCIAPEITADPVITKGPENATRPC